MKTKKIQIKNLKFDQYAFGILIAIELLMSFTFLGYIHVPPISITLAYIPIVAAGCLFGPVESTVIGIIFGLGSMYKASAYYVMDADKVFSPFQSGNPFGSVMLSVGSRALFGLVIGIAFMLVKKICGSSRKQWQKRIIWNGSISLIAPKIHTILVYTVMGIFFPEFGFDYMSGFHYIRREWILAVVCLGIVELIYLLYDSNTVQRFAESVNESEANPYASRRINLIVIVIGIFTICMACFSTLYFAQRAEYMLEQHDLEISRVISRDLLHLQVQFLIAMLALDSILLILLILVYKHMSYKEYMGEMDPLTGIMGRRLFLHYCTEAQSERNRREAKKGWFLFLDVDYFKQINDTFGHTTGDEVLKKVAGILQKTLGEKGAVGRVGGDEFAAMVDQEVSREELEGLLTTFLDDIAGILEKRKVSCSIGVYHFTFPQVMKELLTETDHVLYEAKEKGRARFVIREEESDV